MMRREMLENGSVRLVSEKCQFVYRPLRPGALLVTIDGNDTGQFGRAPLEEIDREQASAGVPLRVFIDASKATGPSTSVMEMWTTWLAARKEDLERVVMLIPEGSKLLHLTVSIAQHLSRTGNLIWICSDEAEFEEAVRECAAASQG